MTTPLDSWYCRPVGGKSVKSFAPPLSAWVRTRAYSFPIAWSHSRFESAVVTTCLSLIWRKRSLPIPGIGRASPARLAPPWARSSSSPQVERLDHLQVGQP